MLAARILFSVAMLLLPARLFSAQCDPVFDANEVVLAHAAIDNQCNCTTAASHAEYMKCVDGVLTTAVENGVLGRPCRRDIKRCRSRSTCGRPGTVTCCRKRSTGTMACTVKSSADACKPTKHGVACLGTTPTCCDACTGECTTTTTVTTTSTTVSTTTTPVPPGCGNHVIDADETCDGDNDFDAGPPPTTHNTCDFGASGKMRCARPNEPGACHRCCGMGIGFTTGLICGGDSACCGQCITYPLPQGRRCTDCPGGQCCSRPGESCVTNPCCAGDSCVSGICCANTNAGCTQNADCCSGSCDTANLRCN